MSNRSFLSDNRAIEGLPIRLVIALVVGVAALSTMMTILDGVGDIGQTEIEYNYDDISHSMNDDIEMEMRLVDENGNQVTESEVIITSGTAQMQGSQSFATNTDSNVVEVSIPSDEVDLRGGQDTGTLEVDIIPPSNSDYADEEANAEIVVFR